jgi:hypothetical protein
VLVWHRKKGLFNGQHQIGITVPSHQINPYRLVLGCWALIERDCEFPHAPLIASNWPLCSLEPSTFVEVQPHLKRTVPLFPTSRIVYSPSTLMVTEPSGFPAPLNVPPPPVKFYLPTIDSGMLSFILVVRNP